MIPRILAAAALLLALCAACNGESSAPTSTVPQQTETLTAPPVTTTSTQTEVETTAETETVFCCPGRPVLPAGAHLLTSDPSLAASDLKVRLGCEEGKGVAHLSWTPAAESGNAELLGKSILPNVTNPRKFEFLQTLPATASSFTWKPLEGQAIHAWVVLTSHGDGWAPSARVSFTGPSCTADFN